MADFHDRHDAGRRLAEVLSRYAGDPDAVVLALPRGGVPVGYEIAERLGLALDIVVVRKLGVPDHEELAMGAIASGGVEVLDHRIIDGLGISAHAVQEVAARELRELWRRESMYRGDWPALDVSGKIAILVDDGLATGSSMKAAVAAIRQRRPVRIVCAVPVASHDAREELAELVDHVDHLIAPDSMYSVGAHYDDFEPTTDAQVRALLDRAARDLRMRADVTAHTGVARVP